MYKIPSLPTIVPGLKLVGSGSNVFFVIVIKGVGVAPNLDRS